MTLVMVGTFLAAWSPYAACVLALTAGGRPPDTLRMVSAYVAKSSTLFNPIIYTLFLTDFRASCKRFLCCDYTELETTSQHRVYKSGVSRTVKSTRTAGTRTAATRTAVLIRTAEFSRTAGVEYEASEKIPSLLKNEGEVADNAGI